MITWQVFSSEYIACVNIDHLQNREGLLSGLILGMVNAICFAGIQATEM
jgi:hypothetical protein